MKAQLRLVHNPQPISEEEKATVAPLFQEQIFIIMWPSDKSGGTYSELRKSEAGKDRFLATLDFMGVDMRKVKVIKQSKPWIPIKGEKRNRNRGKK